MNNTITYPILYDLDPDGGVDVSGKIQEVWNADALNAAIKNWIASYEGEVFRNPNSGGYVTRFLGKPMQSTNVEQFKMIIRNGFDNDFRPYLQVKALELTPHYEERYWEIYLEVYSNDLNIYTIISENIRNKA